MESEIATQHTNRALLTAELEKIFAEAPLAPNALAHPRVREAHARATGKAVATPDVQSSSKKRIPGPDDDCPICYEGMHGVSETLLTFCDECGNTLHQQCFDQCKHSKYNTSDLFFDRVFNGIGKATSKNSGKQLSCVFCRAQWVTPLSGSVGAQSSGQGYINLANVSGISPIRDTSTCTLPPATLVPPDSYFDRLPWTTEGRASLRLSGLSRLVYYQLTLTRVLHSKLSHAVNMLYHKFPFSCMFLVVHFMCEISVCSM